MTKDRRFGYALVVSLTALVTIMAITRSISDGRLASHMTHNDVNYMIEGLRHALAFWREGLVAALHDMFVQVDRAPLSSLQAAAGFILFGVHDWAPYVTNALLVLVCLAFCAHLLERVPSFVF